MKNILVVYIIQNNLLHFSIVKEVDKNFEIDEFKTSFRWFEKFQKNINKINYMLKFAPSTKEFFVFLNNIN